MTPNKLFILNKIFHPFRLPQRTGASALLLVLGVVCFGSQKSYSATNSYGFTGSAQTFTVPTNGTGGFGNPLGGGYTFGVRQDGGNLYATYGQAAPIPKPGTWVAMAIFAGGAVYAGWRRRNKVS